MLLNFANATQTARAHLHTRFGARASAHRLSTRDFVYASPHGILLATDGWQHVGGTRQTLLTTPDNLTNDPTPIAVHRNAVSQSA